MSPQEQPPSILVAMDMPQRAQAVMRGAADLAKALGADVLNVVHAVTEERLAALKTERPEEFGFTDVVLEQIREDFRQQWEEELGQGASAAVIHVVRGEPELVVLEWASRNDPDYVVIGVRNRSRVGKLVFGSTAQSILLGSTAPVVAIPDQG